MQLSFDWHLDPRRLLQPATLFIVASNLLPIVGVLAWGWDVFLVLVLYWFETVIIAFWTVIGVARASPEDAAQFKDKAGNAWSPIPLALFFTAHSGIFMGVHFMFLWALFAGDWPQRVGNVSDFFSLVVWRTGLWIPLLFLVLAHGLSFLRRATGRDPLRAAGRALLGRTSVVAQEDIKPSAKPTSSLGLLYGRIVGMQLAIIFGGMLALTLGSMAPLLILIGIKTVIDAGAVMISEES